VIQSRIIKLVGVASHMGEVIKGQWEVMSLGRHRCRWDNTKTDSKEIGYEGVDRIQLTKYWIPIWGLRVPEKAGNFLNI
jgi:hypothetical protein